MSTDGGSGRGERHGRGIDREATRDPRVIGDSLREQGYPPSVREIGEAVGLTSSSTCTRTWPCPARGYLRRDPTKPRAMECASTRLRGPPWRRAGAPRALLGDVAAGTGVLASEKRRGAASLPEDFTGSGSVFMLRVRGESMIEAGIFDGDLWSCASSPTPTTATSWWRGSPGRGHRQDVRPAPRQGRALARQRRALAMEFSPDDVTIYGGWSPSCASCDESLRARFTRRRDLLHGPAVAVGVAEEDERSQGKSWTSLASTPRPRARHAPRRRRAPQVQALHRSGTDARCPPHGDRARRAGRVSCTKRMSSLTRWSWSAMKPTWSA